ncbi:MULTISPECIES: ABC transporter ATP-binding protein [unclassified Leifsonia]|uniref:ABC transporter ATP-binding protein n=1 Tax=unclassified Leifsonia TaxID=2663824 RepID=UPI0007013A6E|nr:MULTISPECIES: ABC transporter ATP-binding protein [unclassified Leifsonia]KQX08184.1 ABC transporter [Leifsonia sp. Root1293]KRA12466.1 ABC transporter [Leifsonia sp. Root60]
MSVMTMALSKDPLIVCENLVRIYQTADVEVQALQGLDLLVEEGAMVAIVGASGSGKSTLLGILSGLDAATAGAARVAGWDLMTMSAADRLAYRRSTVGFVWQQTGRNLMPYLSALENVELPMGLRGTRASARRERARDLLASLGMIDKAGRRPGELSGGEQQRVAIAVALANEPKLVFADEPTGELDSDTGEEVFAAFRRVNAERGTTVVIVTHDAAVSDQVQLTFAIRDGRTSSEVLRSTRIDEFGDSHVIAREFAVLDRAGRLQLPAGYRQALGLERRVRLELETDHVGVWAEQHEPGKEDDA